MGFFRKTGGEACHLWLLGYFWIVVVQTQAPASGFSKPLWPLLAIPPPFPLIHHFAQPHGQSQQILSISWGPCPEESYVGPPPWYPAINQTSKHQTVCKLHPWESSDSGTQKPIHSQGKSPLSFFPVFSSRNLQAINPFLSFTCFIFFLTASGRCCSTQNLHCGT